MGIVYAALNRPPPMNMLVRVMLDLSGHVNVSCSWRVVELTGVPLRVASV